MAKHVCKSCRTCETYKKQTAKYGKILPKEPEAILWHTLCIDLIGLYKIGKGKAERKLHCLTMIDPATGWFDIVEVPGKTADVISNELELKVVAYTLSMANGSCYG